MTILNDAPEESTARLMATSRALPNRASRNRPSPNSGREARWSMPMPYRACADKLPQMQPYRSHGNGRFDPGALARLGEGTVIEEGVLIFHPENIEIGADVYIGHGAMLKAYYKNRLIIGDGTWIGQGCFIHSAGGIEIGKEVGVGPHVKIITSVHEEPARDVPIVRAPLRFAPVLIEDHSDIGVGSVLLPGVTVGRGAIVGAGSVVTKSVPAWSVVAGNPARVLRERA